MSLNGLQAAAERAQKTAAMPVARLLGLIEELKLPDGVRVRWIGADAVEMAAVRQWLTVRGDLEIGEEMRLACMRDMDAHLGGQTFLTTKERSTLADLAVFHALRPHVGTDLPTALPFFARWFDTLQSMKAVQESDPSAQLVKFKLEENDIWKTLWNAKVSSALPESHSKKKKKIEVENKTQEKKREESVLKTQSKESASACAHQPAVTKLVIKVGRIVECWKHEEAEKLFCEKIDVGEETARSIASGLVGHYNNASELKGHLVLVLCNLKPRNLAGFKSNGMVLCASNEGKSKVELVDPPNGAKIGEIVSFPTIEGGPFQPFTPTQIAKKKVFEEVAPNLRTNKGKQPLWVDEAGKEHLFHTSAGPCSVPSLENAQVS